MESTVHVLDNFTTLTIGILVYFAGVFLSRKVGFLRSYNIPDAVSGGVVASILSLILYFSTGVKLAFTLDIRDVLLVYFFTSIGLNARLSDIVQGGKPLGILLTITIAYIFIQDIVGIAAARYLDLPDAIGLITGSIALIGGHGTAIAWAPELSDAHGIGGALEIGIASATLGLVVASLLGGPIAKYLLNKHKLSGDPSEEHLVGTAYSQEAETQLTHINFMGVILVFHLCIMLGFGLKVLFAELGVRFPLFVTCLIVGMVATNTVPKTFPKMPWPAHTRALSVLSDFSISLFIVMSLMAMELWSIASLAGPMIILIGVQALMTVVFIYLVVFNAMGRDYQAAVICAGFAGFSLGSTPTAIANMSAVTKSHGPAPVAFIILPLVCAFFVSISNAFIIQFFLGS